MLSYTAYVSRANDVAFHAAGPGSILGRVNFLVEVFSGVFPQLQDKRQGIWATFVPGYHLAIMIIRNHILPSTDDGL